MTRRSLFRPHRWATALSSSVKKALIEQAHRYRPMRRLGVFALALIQAGCGAGWRTTQLAAGPLPARQQAEVWTGGRALRWHALVVATDSISGVPFTSSPGCDSCRVALPRGSVDSVRLGNPTAGFWKSVGLGMGISFATALVICRFSRSCQLGD